MVLFRAGTYCESWSDDLDMKFMNSDMNSKKMRKFFRNSNSKKNFAIFAGLRKIAKRSEFASLRFAEKIPGFAFASLRFLIRKKIRFRFAFAIDFWPKFTALL
jgi:hypothetical protein